jgi:hypothetical protein
MGTSYLFRGGSTLSGTPALCLTGGNNLSYSDGVAVSAAGDVNADGYADFITSGSAAAYLYLGGSALDDVVDVTFTGSSGFGCSVASAGDLDADGYGDILVGKTGSAFVYHGSASTGTLNSDSLMVNGSMDFGQNVACTGDINRDGRSEIILGDSGDGVAYIFSGMYLYDWSVKFTGTAGLFGASVAEAPLAVPEAMLAIPPRRCWLESEI